MYDVEMMQAKTGLYPVLELEMTIILAQSRVYNSHFTPHSRMVQKMHAGPQHTHGCLSDSAVSDACIGNAWKAL